MVGVARDIHQWLIKTIRGSLRRMICLQARKSSQCPSIIPENLMTEAPSILRRKMTRQISSEKATQVIFFVLSKKVVRISIVLILA